MFLVKWAIFPLPKPRQVYISQTIGTNYSKKSDQRDDPPEEDGADRLRFSMNINVIEQRIRVDPRLL